MHTIARHIIVRAAAGAAALATVTATAITIAAGVHPGTAPTATALCVDPPRVERSLLGEAPAQYARLQRASAHAAS